MIQWSKLLSSQFFPEVNHRCQFFVLLVESVVSRILLLLSLIFKLITNRWAWALVPTKLVEPGNALTCGRGIHGNPASGPHPTRNSWCLKKEGPANRGEMEPTPTTPSTKLKQLRQTDNTFTKGRQLTMRAIPKTTVQAQGSSVRNSTVMLTEL